LFFLSSLSWLSISGATADFSVFMDSGFPVEINKCSFSLLVYKKYIFISHLYKRLKTEKSNRDLLLLVKEDDMLAFYQIYERYCKRLYGFILKYIKQESEAEEIVQEVFLKIWESRDKVDVYSSFESYLFTIAYNTTMSLFRKKVHEKKYLEHLKSLQQADLAPEITNEIHFRELNEKVQILLNKLTPRQKEILLLSREEGLTHDEIANKLNISLNTVKKHMVNTLSFLKSNIDTSLMINLLFVHLFL
jgi:RNA polymerase sigma-70 factor (ECF subfamily)